MNLPISSLQFVDVENNLSQYIVPHFVSIIEEKAENETKSFVPKSLIELYTEDISNGDTAAMMKVAMVYLNEKNVNNAIEWFTKAVDAGETEAMCRLGHVYEDDLKEYNKAFEWFMKGAEKGDAQCMSNVGRMYYEGKGTMRNNLLAIEWWTKAAENGRKEAMYKLGHVYEDDLKEYNKAFEWFMKGAEKGDAQCMSNVGRMYNDGKGTVRNNSLAIEWWTKDSENGRTGAMCQLAFYYFLDEKNYEKSFEWYKKAAEYGDAFAMFKLGLYYYEGIGTERNIDLATRWLTKNTEKGEGYADDHALILLGRIYNEELHDYKKSFEFYQKASQSDTKNTEYMYYLGLFYYEGKGTIQNKSLAIDWLVKAATTYKNDRFGSKAMNKLGHIYSSDKDYKDDTKAVEWYKRAANAGDIDSMFDLGLFDYINKNKEDFWLHQAAEEGHITAMFVIALIYSKKHPDKWFEQVTQEWYKRFNNAKPLHTNDVLSYYYSWSHCYYKGIGVQKNIEMAIQYMKIVEDTLKNSIGCELDSVLNVLWGEPPIRRILYELGVMYEGVMNLYDKDLQQKTNNKSITDFEIREIIKAVEESRKNAFLYYKSSAELDYIPAIAAIIRCYVTRTFGSLDLEKSIGPWMDKGFDKQKNGTEYNILVYAMQGKKWSLDSL